VNKLLKLDPSNTTLLAQKQELLQQKISETKNKLNVLKEADKQAKLQLEKGELGKDKYDALQREIVETEQQLKNLKKTAGSGSATLEKVSVVSGKVGKGLTNAGKAIMPASAAIAGIGAVSVNVANDFESAMSQAAGALNMPMSQMGELRDLAIKTGQDTIFSAKEAGQAITELAKGGLSEADIKAGALKATMDLAASSGMDLGNAANVTVQAMGAFGLSAEKSAMAANALAGAAAASSTDVEPLTQGLSQASAQAKNAGWSIQETTAVLGKFADAGIVGSDAGTSLKTMLQRLAAPTDTVAKEIEKLGINTRDSQGNLLGASDMAQELQNKLGSLSSAQRDAALQTIFGSDATRAATVLMNSGSEGLASYIKATNDQEAAQRLANSQMGEGEKAIEEMKGSLETAAITIGSKLAPVITKVVEFITDLVNKFSALPNGVQTAIVVIGAIIAVLGPLLIIIGQIAMGVSALTAAFSALSVPLLPIIAIIAAVIAAIVAIVLVIKNWGTITEWFGNLWSAICGKIQEIASTVATFVSEKISALAQSLSGIWENIKTIAAAAWEMIKNIILGPVLLLCDLVTGDFNKLKSDAQNIWDNIKKYASIAWNALKDLVTSVANGLKEKAVEAFRKMVSGIGEKLSSLGSTVQSGFQSAIDFITSLPGKALEWGKDFIQGLIDGIKSMISKVTDAVKDVADKIRSFLHFSRPDEGPLREYETWMPDFMDGMAKGIYSNIPKIERAIRAVSGTMDLSVSKEFKTQGMDYDKMYQVVRAGSSGEMVMMLNHRVVGRVLKEMGVVFA
jgi:TP901 family phage tail tape measure protein